jgi:hypothetical protein
MLEPASCGRTPETNIESRDAVPGRSQDVTGAGSATRAWTATFSIDAQARAWADRLVHFRQSRASPVAPASGEDMDRIQTLATIERSLQGAIALPAQNPIISDVAAALGGSEAAQPDTQAARPKPRFCPSCGRRNPASARRCMGCGVKFEG